MFSRPASILPDPGESDVEESVANLVTRLKSIALVADPNTHDGNESIERKKKSYIAIPHSSKRNTIHHAFSSNSPAPIKDPGESDIEESVANLVSLLTPAALAVDSNTHDGSDGADRKKKSYIAKPLPSKRSTIHHAFSSDSPAAIKGIVITVSTQKSEQSTSQPVTSKAQYRARKRNSIGECGVHDHGHGDGDGDEHNSPAAPIESPAGQTISAKTHNSNEEGSQKLSVSGGPVLSKNGVTIEFLHSLRGLVHTRDPTISIAKLKTDIIKPYCKIFSSSLSDLLQIHYSNKEHTDFHMTGKECIGEKANVFVCYYHFIQFKEFVRTIDTFHNEFLQSNPDVIPYYWIDFCCTNLSIKHTYSDNWWTSVYLQFIHSMSHMCVVLTPVDRPRILSNTRCLFEILCGIYSKTVKIVMQVNSHDEDILKRIIHNNPEEGINILVQIDVRNAECDAGQGEKTSLVSAMQCTLATSDDNVINKYISAIFKKWAKSIVVNEVSLLTNFDEAEAIRPESLKLLNFMVTLLEDPNDFAVVEILYKKIVPLLESSLGNDHVETIQGVLHLAAICRAQNNFAEAEVLYRRVLASRLLTLDEDDVLISESLFQLADIVNNQGKTVEARTLYQTALRNYEKSGRTMEDACALSIIHDLAVTLNEQGEVKEATALHRRSLIGRRSIAANNSTTTTTTTSTGDVQSNTPSNQNSIELDLLSSQKSLAEILYSERKFDEAEGLFRTVLSGYRQLFGHNSLEVMHVMHFLAMILKEKCSYDECYHLYSNIYEICVRNYDDQDPLTLSAAQELSVIAVALGHKDSTYKHHFSVKDDKNGYGGTTTRSSLSDLSHLLSNFGKEEQAIVYQRKLLAMHETNDGPNNPKTMSEVYKLSALLESRQMYPEAEALTLRQLQYEEEAFGPMHVHTLATVHRHGEILRQLGMLVDADKEYRKALFGRLRTLGPANMDTNMSLKSLVDLLQMQDQGEEIVKLLKDYSQAVIELNGPTDKSIIHDVLLVPAKQLVSKNPKDAEKMLRDICGYCREAFGADHVDTIDVEGLLADALYEQMCYTAAEALYKHILAVKDATLGLAHTSSYTAVTSSHL